MLADDDVAMSSRAENTARVRRLSRRIMAILDHDRVWTGPMGEIAAEAAVAHCVQKLFEAGERDEHLIMQRVMQTICNGRVTSLLKSQFGAVDADVGTSMKDLGVN